MKCLEIARLQEFAPNTQGLLGALSGPQTPCRIERTPLWKFLPTDLNGKWVTKNLKKGLIFRIYYQTKGSVEYSYTNARQLLYGEESVKDL